MRDGNYSSVFSDGIRLHSRQHERQSVLRSRKIFQNGGLTMSRIELFEELMDMASMLLSEMVVTDNRDERYELMLQFKEAKAEYLGDDIDD